MLGQFFNIVIFRLNYVCLLLCVVKPRGTKLSFAYGKLHQATRCIIYYLSKIRIRDETLLDKHSKWWSKLPHQSIKTSGWTFWTMIICTNQFESIFNKGSFLVTRSYGWKHLCYEVLLILNCLYQKFSFNHVLWLVGGRLLTLLFGLLKNS